jgi:AcrR family transcriptional regulator
MSLMRRPSREELDQAIIDTAAVLFARHGYSHTSVQQIADAVGYSKTGLLHRFPSKEALRRAVADQFLAELDTVAAAVQELPVGAQRDLAVIRVLADLVLHRRGTTALMISALTAWETPGDLAWMDGVAEALFRAFGLTDTADQDRCLRIYGALGAAGVIALTVKDLPPGAAGEQVRDLLVVTAFGALGHPRPADAVPAR